MKRSKHKQPRIVITISRRNDGLILDSFPVTADWRNAEVEEEAVGTNATEGMLIARIKRALENADA